MNPIIVSITGLGYVGLPVAIAFSKLYKTIGFDTDVHRINELSNGCDRNSEYTQEDISGSNLTFTSNPKGIESAQFHIIAVPTPLDEFKKPDLRSLFAATESVGKILKKGDVVVFESTTYPGATEGNLLPILEKQSSLKVGVDFKIGYSPERINPADKEHTFEKIQKIVSGIDKESLDAISRVYESVIPAGVFKASSIRVAETAKIVENSQRDLNIAFMNEVALICETLKIDTHDVLQAASTKWNFLNFKPGLVGGHCVGVAPYYLSYKAKESHYSPDLLLKGRHINEQMGSFIAQKTIKEMLAAEHPLKKAQVSILGFSFKENCKDHRDSKVLDIIRELNRQGIKTEVCDPIVDSKAVARELGLTLLPFEALSRSNAIIIAVNHRQFKEFTPEQLKSISCGNPVLIDVKGMCNPEDYRQAGFRYWRL